MVLEERIALMTELGQYFLDNNEDWQTIVRKAYNTNAWFTEQSIQLSATNIALQFLQKEKLENWVSKYPSFNSDENNPPLVGVVMAGNIPMVGFHDFLCVFISGCKLKIKLSSKDTILWESIFHLLNQWNPAFSECVNIADRLNGCDAFIATGSNNTARHFEYYFRKYPHIIRSNRTSVAILDGNETWDELESLSDDICTYFGFGCRNVSKIFVPEHYNFEPLIKALDNHAENIEHNKYKNNYDFQLALYLLNRVEYMSSQSVLVVPSKSAFAPISVLHYETYNQLDELVNDLMENEEIQCIVSSKTLRKDKINTIDFGSTQKPELDDYADGVSTLDFLDELRKNKKTNT